MLYAMRTPAGPVQIFPDTPFATAVLKISDEAEGAIYAEEGKPAPRVGEFINHPLRHSANALELWSDEDFERYGCLKVAEPPTPMGKVCKGYTFMEQEGKVIASGIFADPPVPEQVPKVQLYMALEDKELFDDFQLYLTDPDRCPKAVAIYFQHAHVIERNHSKTIQAFDGFGFTSDDVDALFLNAANQS